MGCAFKVLTIYANRNPINNDELRKIVKIVNERANSCEDQISWCNSFQSDSSCINDYLKSLLFCLGEMLAKPLHIKRIFLFLLGMARTSYNVG